MGAMNGSIKSLTQREMDRQEKDDSSSCQPDCVSQQRALSPTQSIIFGSSFVSLTIRICR